MKEAQPRNVRGAPKVKSKLWFGQNPISKKAEGEERNI